MMSSENIEAPPPPAPVVAQPTTVTPTTAPASVSSATAASMSSASKSVPPPTKPKLTSNTTKPVTNGGPVVNGSNGLRVLRPETYVGFDSLPDQFVSRVIRDGFGFNILALGCTGVGKTTMLESLFNTKFTGDSSTRSHGMSTVSVSSQQIELNEGSIKLKLTLVESKGFGDQIDKSESYKSIVEYIDAQFEKYLQEELKIHRSQSSLSDSRIHCCLYILSPVGHGLRALDLVTMKALHNKVNLIPIIGKSDTFTKHELEHLRSRIISELNANGIEYYRFPVDDPEVAEVNSSNNSLMPFAVVASNDFIRIGSKHIRARQYPWGTVHVENENHCDFVRFRDMVIRVNMEDLREKTHSKHYELYRRVRLQQMGFGGDENGVDGATNGHGHSTSFKETFEWRRQAHLESLQRREDEMRAAFVQRVKVKEQELKENERELHNRFDRLKRESADEKKRLERDRLTLDDEINAFGQKKAAVLGNSTLMHNVMAGKIVDKSKKK